MTAGFEPWFLFPDYARHLPQYVQIETTNRCNLSCVMCAHSDPDLAPSLNTRHMSFEEFQTLLGQLPSVAHVVYQGAGEPLLNPDLPRMIRFVRELGVSGECVTNGMVLDEDLIATVIDCGLSRLDVSIDSADPELFARLRCGAKLDRVLRNLGLLVSRCADRGPVIACRTVVTAYNVEGLPRLAETLEMVGVRHLLLTGVKTAPDDPGGLATSKEVWRELQSLADRFNRDPTRGLRIALRYYPGEREDGLVCPWPWRGAFISVEGLVAPCCYLPSAIVNFGNAFETPFRTIWNNRAFRGFREGLMTRAPTVCGGCVWYDALRGVSPSLDRSCGEAT